MPRFGKQTQFPRSGAASEDEMRKRTQLQIVGRPDAGPTIQTNPIWQGQSYQTKPIGGRSNERQSLDTTRVMAVSVAFPAVQNKANSRWGPGRTRAGCTNKANSPPNYVKQTQFLATPRRVGPSAEPIVRHRPDAPLRETKPISSGRTPVRGAAPSRTR